MSLPSTPLCLPRHLPYPLTIRRIHSHPNAAIRKTDVLCTYSYLAPAQQVAGITGGGEKERERDRERVVESWESPIEGIVDKWMFKEGEKIVDSNSPIVHIKEPCTHDVQLHGLCALCGRDLTGTDYTGFSDTSRAAISMVHDVGGLTVSLDEAHRLETLTTRRLLSSRKLSLIVDLDQTIIHATVDPTVKEWLKDEKNPNWSALRGVEKFRLGESEDEATEEGCWYYVKMRPGLRTFLQRISEIYEMHVYTMGTRGYAAKVCKIIDPDGALFGGRILSRDESGSMTRKSLQRLFPCDTNMVVIIDDRADVWDGSPNLVKVIPYEFFVGIGDINAAFLPKKKDLTATPEGAKPSSSSSSPASSSSSGSGASGSPSGEEGSTSDGTEATSPAASNAASNASVLLQGAAPSDRSDLAVISPSISEAEASKAATIQDQIENRPLSRTQTQSNKSKVSPSPSASVSVDGDEEGKKGKGKEAVGGGEQENSDDDDDDAEEDEESDDEEEDDVLEKVGIDQEEEEEEEEVQEAVLKDDDRELDRLENVLTEVWDTFFLRLDSKQDADVRIIIPSMKQQVLSGVNLIFSGVIALGARPEDSEYWKLATAFGAKCTTEMSSRLTHMVASQNNTAKVHQARSMPRVRVVWTQWLLDSAAHWHRQNESLYLMSYHDSEAPKSPIVDLAARHPENDDPNNIIVSRPPSPSPEPSDFGGGSLDITEVDWGDADKELEDFLNETDDEDASDGNLTDGSTASTSAKKRPRAQTDSEDESASPSTSAAASASLKAAHLGEGSPLQKRVKTSRSRKSKLKVSFPANVGESDPPSTPPKPLPNVNGNGSGPPSPAGGDGYAPSQASSSLDSDDEGFLASMAAEVELGFSKG